MTEEQNKGGEQQKAESDRRAEFMKVAKNVAAKIAALIPPKCAHRGLSVRGLPRVFILTLI